MPGLDIEHAGEFLARADDGRNNPEIRAAIASGVRPGAYVFDRL